MKVENLFNPDTGNDVANQFRIYTGKGVIFQSYETTICIKENGKVFLNNAKLKDLQNKQAWKSSRTTSKWLRIFLNEDKETIDNKIASGEYILTDLNT
jgi:tryptophanyl-tRNA synthetase